MPQTTALDTTIDVVTPENIAFDYQLAGPFRRFPAYLIDWVIQWAIILGFAILVIMSGVLLVGGGASPFAQAIILIAWFVVSFFYGTVCETVFNGRTAGKAMCGLRVIDVEGRPLSGSQAFLRNLIRVADTMPLAPLPLFVTDGSPMARYIIPTGMVALVVMTTTRRMQRLGDLAAGTMVIIDERAIRLPVVKVDDPRVPALASYIPGDYRVSRQMARMLAMYIERRSYLTPPRRREVAKHITGNLVERFDFRPDIDPDLLLYSLYYQTFLRDEQSPPPDLGALAGFSPLAKDAHRVGGGTAGNNIAASRGIAANNNTTAMPPTAAMFQSNAVPPTAADAR
ncbi:MAG: RDD family protein [Planctomycetota bacterium]